MFLPFPLGCDNHVYEKIFSSSLIIKAVHVRRLNHFRMKNKCLPFLLLSEGKLSYMPLHPLSLEKLGMCVLFASDRHHRATDQVPELDRSSNPSHPTKHLITALERRGRLFIFLEITKRLVLRNQAKDVFERL